MRATASRSGGTLAGAAGVGRRPQPTRRAGQRHAGQGRAGAASSDVLLRREEVVEEGVLTPRDARVLVGLGEVVASGLACIRRRRCARACRGGKEEVRERSVAVATLRRCDVAAGGGSGRGVAAAKRLEKGPRVGGTTALEPRLDHAPDWRPKMPLRLGPCLCAPPASTVWHCEHLVLKILAPLVSDMV